MIEFENQIFSDLSLKLRESYPEIYTAPHSLAIAPQFPAVSIVMSDSAPYLKSADDVTRENHAKITYLIEIYTNGESGKKTQANAIRDIIDTMMSEWGFTRLSCAPVPNLEDMTIYRITMRYQGVADADGYIYVD